MVVVIVMMPVVVVVEVTLEGHTHPVEEVALAVLGKMVVAAAAVMGESMNDGWATEP